MSGERETVRLVGAGPTGALLAILLERGGRSVELYDSRADPLAHPAESGRSINLALASRGIHALKAAGVFERLRGELLPMRGRLVHGLDGKDSFQPYGTRSNEVIYSISRHRLNQLLLEAARARPSIRTLFEHRFEGAELDEGVALIRDLRRGRLLTVPMQPLIAADGAGSAMRRRLSSLGVIEALETDLEHGYKELSIPPAADGAHALRADALHIWPRGNFMLIALPNADGSFTATLFLAKRGETSFASLAGRDAVEHFFSANFPDARALMPDCVDEFAANPMGFLGTVSAAPWSHQGMTALIGDAAHAMVPFHGQGMNCCFEDCMELDACVEEQRVWARAFDAFFERRKPNTDAIAAMALDNYLEMRDRVADAKFQLQQALAHELERRFPERFVPRYSMVMFHHEIPYRVALERGAVQSRLLQELTADPVTSLDGVDFARAGREVLERLPVIEARAGERSPSC